jgi:protein-L-isoaspartate(D-aspartate) O-methyltransferase
MNSVASASSGLSPAFFSTARFNMVESQLRPNGILDEKLLASVSRLPREAFVPEDVKSFAYMDEDVPVGFGRKLLAPMVVARLIQAMNIQPSDRILDVGPATGYSSAILNDMAGEVIALESDPALLRQLQHNVTALELENVRPVQGALGDGFAPASPYHGILIEGAIQWLPERLGQQLIEGGRLACIVYPEGDTFGKMGEARIYERMHGVLSERSLFNVAAPLLPGFMARPRFMF